MRPSFLAAAAAAALSLLPAVAPAQPLKPGHAKPLVAILVDAAGAETTDTLVPYSVLKESGAVEVALVATRSGPVHLMPALTVLAETDVAAFRAAHPEGADVVIVPAQHDPAAPVLQAFVKDEARHGALMVSICEGARVLAKADLLKGRQATTHWFAMGELRRAYPDTRWVAGVRYIVDGPVMTTAGVTASLPASLALVERFAGAETARATAARFGLSGWSERHDMAPYRLTASRVGQVIGGGLSLWDHPVLRLPLVNGVDEAALALEADAWSRTSRSSVITVAAGPVATRHGLTLMPESADRDGRGERLPTPRAPAAAQLSLALAAIDRRFGPGARDMAAVQLEYGPEDVAALSKPD
jgi:putative intracellular protease/amidase